MIGNILRKIQHICCFQLLWEFLALYMELNVFDFMSVGWTKQAIFKISTWGLSYWEFLTFHHQNNSFINQKSSQNNLIMPNYLNLGVSCWRLLHMIHFRATQLIIDTHRCQLITSSSPETDWYQRSHLLFGTLHATLGLALLLRCLGLVPPHARDVVFVAHVPALLWKDIHFVALATGQTVSSSQLREQGH